MGHIKKYKCIIHKCTLVARQREVYLFLILFIFLQILFLPRIMTFFLNKKKRSVRQRRTAEGDGALKRAFGTRFRRQAGEPRIRCRHRPQDRCFGHPALFSRHQFCLGGGGSRHRSRCGRNGGGGCC